MVAMGSNGSQIPEDYLENGSLWEHLSRGGITFRNYGEGFEFPDNDEGPMENRTGAFTQVNYPMPKVLFDNTDFDYPAYNNNIPDIARADWFVEDLEQYRKEHDGKIPQFMNIAICNDHGAEPAPKRGYPYVCSYMADNDWPWVASWLIYRDNLSGRTWPSSLRKMIQVAITIPSTDIDRSYCASVLGPSADTYRMNTRRS